MKKANYEFSSKQHIGMPMQASPVHRTMAGAGAISDASGIEASGWWDTLKSVASTVAPYAAKVAGALL
ncbi:hypothetical protein [Duganella vulcania]|uniref:Uncharacterized protein n=1 Tax=Duganella vulcania TaxID=2692166 RepID=A0A845GZ50_9BURK|nr:hypothetical protein [Duganella vulcania]MYM97759.1 hypothetical protein [Duganella vulcania]